MTDDLRDRASCVLVRDGKLLLVRADEPTYMLPGGGVDPGETVAAAAIRELREETGLVATHTEFLYVFETSTNRHHFFAVQADGKVDVDGGECHGFLWWDIESELPVYPHVTSIRDWLRSSRLTDESDQ